MARKQTRRSIYISRLSYEAAKQAGAIRGVTIAGLVEGALGTIGVPVVDHPQQSPARVSANAARRTKRTVLRPILRRSVSINRLTYEAAKREASRRGMTIAGLVEVALSTINDHSAAGSALPRRGEQWPHPAQGTSNVQHP